MAAVITQVRLVICICFNQEPTNDRKSGNMGCEEYPNEEPSIGRQFANYFLSFFLSDSLLLLLCLLLRELYP